MSGLKQSLVGVLLSDVCAETSIGVNLQGPAVGTCVCVCVCVCGWSCFCFCSHSWRGLTANLQRHHTASSSSSSSSSPSLPYFFRFLLFLYSSFHPLSLSLSFRPAFCAFICPVLPLSLSLCASIFLSQHAKGIRQRVLIFEFVFIDSSMWSLTAPSFWDKTTKSAPHLWVCVCVLMPPTPACVHMWLRGWFRLIYGFANIGLELKIRYQPVRVSYLWCDAGSLQTAARQ